MPWGTETKMNVGWIDPGLLRDFQAEGTDAYRLCTLEDGWVERFGSDVLLSFKRVLTRERLLEELKLGADWSTSMCDASSHVSFREKTNVANRQPWSLAIPARV